MNSAGVLTACPVSGGDLVPVFSATVLDKYQVQYLYCPLSGLLTTEAPYWLQDAYSSAIATTDTGLVQRNINNAALLESIITLLGTSGGKVLDLAGGYGLLTRLLRDRGFDCYTTDPHCKNIMAAGFEPADEFSADLLLAFEVLEHLEDPAAFVRDAFQRFGCRTLVFSTVTFEGDVPGRDWWYYAFETGQHITFYQPRTLIMLASSVGCGYLRLRCGLHLFFDQQLPKAFLLSEGSGLANRLMRLAVKRKRRSESLTHTDYIDQKLKLSTRRTG